MFVLKGRPAPSEQHIADSLRALRLTVLAFLILDVGATLLGPSYGVTGLGPTGLLAGTQMVLCVAAAAAAMWYLVPAAVVLCGLVAVLSVLVGGSGEEPWLLVITGIVTAARANPVQLAGVLGGYVAYAASFALSSEQRHPGWKWANFALAMGLALAGLAAGLIARGLLRARDRRRERVRQLERENTQIRAVERGRLADDLQAVVTGGLQAIGEQVDSALRSGDAAGLREGLVRIDDQCRDLLNELRALLEVLRRDPTTEVRTTPAAPESRARRWVNLFTARHVRMAASAVFTVLAVRAATGLGWPANPNVLVEVVGLLACAIAVWRARIGAASAAAALVVSLVVDSTDYWNLLPAAVVGLIGALRLPPRRVWLVAAALATYCGLLAWVGSANLLDRVLGVCYLGFIAVAVGMAARHFLEARRESLRQQTALMRVREHVEAEERSAVARDLHDVVAHQLSMVIMLMMATPPDADADVLGDTLEKVRRSTDAAGQELGTLLSAMRRPAADELRPTPLITPSVSAEVLARRLSENGFHPVLDIDPAADALDPTAQRTLGRIMQEGTTNIVRYAAPKSTCRYTLAVREGGVRLSIASPLGAGQRRSDLSLGWGLRGVRERVNLTRGTFSAGPSRGQWVLVVDLPATVSTSGRPAVGSAPPSSRLT